MDVTPVGLRVAQLSLLGSLGKEIGDPLHWNIRETKTCMLLKMLPPLIHVKIVCS